MKHKLKHRLELHKKYSVIQVRFKKAAWIVRHRITPFLRWLCRLILVATIIAVVVTLTRYGLLHQRNNDYRDLLGILVGTIGTVIAVFFSLALIPLNQMSSKYSPSFLKYLRNDGFFKVVLSYSFCSLAYTLIFLLIGSNKDIATATVILFLYLFILLIASWQHIIFLANPFNSILRPVHDEIVKKFRKQIPKARKQRVRSLKELSTASQQVGYDMSYFSIESYITDYIQERIVPIRGIALNAIKELELEQAKSAIQVMSSVVVNYLNARQQYYSDDDPIMYFIYTELSLLTKAASQTELKHRLDPFIVECWKNIGISAAKVNIKGLNRVQNNINSLVVYPVNALREICALNLAEADSYAPGKACGALRDIGTVLMSEGYDQQAAHIVEELAKISLVAEAASIRIHSGNANYAIMQIYGSGLAYRNVGSRDDYPYTLIHKSINTLLASFLRTRRTVYDNQILGSFIGWLSDIFKGINFARIAEYALFSEDLSEESLTENMQSIDEDIDTMITSLGLLLNNNDGYFSKQLLENLYLIFFILISYINNDIAKDHIFYYSSVPRRNDELLKKAHDIVLKIVDVFIGLAKNRDVSIMEDDQLNMLFSLYLSLLYETRKRKKSNLLNLFKDVHEKMKILLEDYNKLPNADPNDSLYKYYRLLTFILKNNKYYILAKDFEAVPDFVFSTGTYAIISESEYPELIRARRWCIKRPTVQRNTYYYNDIEKAFGID